ncbi:uncharacterized protein BX664DRAFT_324442 [Halteromyces radiatus]|uniref:uncharacterized protein n=1 Tax=Halteromyces radiatus TaxID=101107 RepID=UPI002220202F|nr:uncharacterized protein BX664DRAFT_324442 [Halteromyces radiatus]KAI8096623.1 hypothetical protein BX664DRAFT_324442 [Halteromyces radiatus]
MDCQQDWQTLFGSDDEDYDMDTTTTATTLTRSKEFVDIQVETIEQIPGLRLWRNALDHTQQIALIQAITDHNIFGQGNQAMRFGQLGPELENLATWIYDHHLLPSHLSHRVPLFDQAIYNFYNKGEGIISHVDLAKFDDGIVILSLLSSCCMTMKPTTNPQQAIHQGYLQQQEQELDERSIDIILRPGDVLMLSGPSRYLWEHGIAERDIDLVGEEIIVRGTRISVTLRKLLPIDS